MKTEATLSPDWLNAEKAVVAYGLARKRFRDERAKLGHRFLGHSDNIVGSVGEFWAKLFYESQGYTTETPQEKNRSGWDLKAVKAAGRTKTVSVKCITDENAKGQTTSLKANGEWDEFCLILLDELLIPYRVGSASRAAYERAKLSKSAKVARTWVEKGGWIARYGEIKGWK
jgi:hypothetical protein